MSGSKYQVALSFAGEQQWYVEEVARNLKDQGVSVFYDRFEKKGLWGRNLAEAFHEVFSRAEYVVIFISQDYVSKPWPRDELRSALDRMIQLDREYILPVRFDDTPVPGLHSNISYVRDKDYTPAQLAALIVEWIVQKRSIVDAQGKASDVLLPTVSGTFTVSTGGHGQQETPSPTDNGTAKPAASETGERAGVETASFGGHGAVTRTDLDAVLQALQRRFPTGQHYTAEDVSKWGLVRAAIEWLKEEIERAQVPDSLQKAMEAARRALWTTPCTASPKSPQEMVSAQQQRVSEDLVARLTPEQKAELTLPQALKGRALDNKEARTTFFNDWCEQHDLPAPDDLAKVFEQQCWPPSEEDCKSLRAAWQVAKWNREKPSP